MDRPPRLPAACGTAEGNTGLASERCSAMAPQALGAEVPAAMTPVTSGKAGALLPLQRLSRPVPLLPELRM